MKALIDADIVTYRCAAVTADADEGIARWQAGELVKRILDETASDSYQLFLTGSGNFRFGLYPDYKANRTNLPKPRHWATIREYLVTEWGATVTDGHEADDAMGVAQTEDTVICSLDKDMMMIPGNHWNFVKKEWLEIKEPYATRWLYYQALMGDKVDNIPGFDGTMRNKVPKFMKWMIDELEQRDNEQEWYDFLLNVHCANVSLDVCLKCLWIWREDGDIWKSPMERRTP